MISTDMTKVTNSIRRLVLQIPTPMRDDTSCMITTPVIPETTAVIAIAPLTLGAVILFLLIGAGGRSRTPNFLVTGEDFTHLSYTGFNLL